MEALVVFLLQAVGISLSGVMAPGPMTAAALAAGTRSRHAGARIAIGHGVIEFPLMLLIMGGTGRILASEPMRVGIGLAGGAVLVLMGVQMLKSLRRVVAGVAGTRFQSRTSGESHTSRESRTSEDSNLAPASTGNLYAGKNPVWTGILLSGGNPYFLLWWATVGLALASRASELGALAFGLFAIAHWLCDLVWLEALSWAGFKGSRLLGGRTQRTVLFVCALALLFFGAMFIYDAAARLIKA